MIIRYDKQKVQSMNSKAIELETYLMKQIPNTFINFFEIANSVRDSFIEEYSSSVVHEKIDFSDKIISNTLKQYVQLADKIHEMHIFPTDPKYKPVGSFVEKFLYAQYFFQELRKLIYRGRVGVFQLEKILNEKERDLFATNEAQPRNYPILKLYIPEALFMDEFGNLDEEKTVENELKTGRIRTTLSSLDYANYKEILLFNFQNYSKLSFFGILDEPIADILCEASAKEICRLFAISTYYYIMKGLSVENAYNKSKKDMSQVANEYLTSGDSQKDTYKLAENIYVATSSILNGVEEYNKEKKNTIALEMVRLSMQMLRNGTYLPKRYFTLKFRQALEIEKPTKDVENVMEANLIGEDRKSLNIGNDLYIINLTPESKKQIEYISSRGIENTDFVQDLIRSYVSIVAT
jgi:hypothetical protein